MSAVATAKRNKRAARRAAQVQSGTCRVCGCTDDNACDGGCSWADESETLCSRCAETDRVEPSNAVAFRKLPIIFDASDFRGAVPCEAAVFVAQDRDGQWYGSSCFRWLDQVPWPELTSELVPSAAKKFGGWKAAVEGQVGRLKLYLQKSRETATGPGQLEMAAAAALAVITWGEAVAGMTELPGGAAQPSPGPERPTSPTGRGDRPAESRLGVQRSAEQLILVEKIHRRPDNRGGVPVTRAEVAELAESLRAFGQLEPVEVRAESEQQELPEGHYELISGERRWVANQVVGLETIRAVVVTCTPATAAVQTAAHNSHRRDLDVIERAKGLQAAVASGIKIEVAGLAYGLGASAVKNALRLLELPAEVQAAVRLPSDVPGHVPQATALAAIPLLAVPGVREELVAAVKRRAWWLADAKDARAVVEDRLLPKHAVPIESKPREAWDRSNVIVADPRRLKDADREALGVVEVRTGNRPKLYATNLAEVARRKAEAEEEAETKQKADRKAAVAAGRPANPEAERKQDETLRTRTEELAYLWLRLLMAEALQPGDPRTLRVIWWLHSCRNRYGQEVPVATFLDGALAIRGRAVKRKGYRDASGWELAAAAIGADDWVTDHEVTETLLAQLILWPVYRPMRAPEEYDETARYSKELAAPHTIPEDYCRLERDEVLAAAEWLAKTEGPQVHGEHWATTLADGWRAASERATSPHRRLFEQWLGWHNGRQLHRLCKELKIEIDPDANVADRRAEIVSRHGERRLPLPKCFAKLK